MLADRLAAFEGFADYSVAPFLEGAAHLVHALWLLGDASRAREVREASLAAADRLGHPLTLAVVLQHATFSSWVCGDTDEAHALSRRGLELGAEHGLDEASAIFTLFRGTALVQAGRPEEGLPIARQGFERFATATRLASPMFATFAACCLQAGEATEGLAVVEQGLDPDRSKLDHMFEAELWRLKGELLLARDRGRAPQGRPGPRKRTGSDLEEANACLEQALATSRRQHARGAELRAASSLARLGRDRGDLEGSRDLLTPLVAAFDETLDTPDLGAARQLLREIGGGNR
jgi:tetratricopeptide (TPR) repeat protein